MRRRTHLLFQKAFGNNVAVGVIAVPNPDYDARRWWRYSDGVRDLIGESIAYIYAKSILLFRRNQQTEKETRNMFRHPLLFNNENRNRWSWLRGLASLAPIRELVRECDGDRRRSREGQTA